MKSPATSSLLTRPSLLGRLRDWEDDTSWEEFYRLYRQLVYGLARRSGLEHPEAEDVVQEVFQHVAAKISEFEARPNRGAFRRWLMNQTRWRVVDKFRERAHGNPQAGDTDANPVDQVAAQSTPTAENDEAGAPSDEPSDGAWEDEWQRQIFDTALERLAQRVPAKQFQAFELYSRRGWTVREVAEELGLSSAAVYVHNHRLTKQLRREVERLKRTLD